MLEEVTAIPLDFRRPSRSHWFALWYFCIGAGFLLLAVRSYLVEGKFALTILRVVIAIGFALLGYFQLQSPKPRF